MTREQLEEYSSKKEEIAELKNRLSNLNDDESMVDNDTILDYRSGFPVPETIVGMDAKKYWKTRDRCVKRIVQLEKECDEIEEFVESIDESLMRRICRMIYLEGKSQKETGKAVHMDRSRISRKLKQFFSDKIGN